MLDAAKAAAHPAIAEALILQQQEEIAKLKVTQQTLVQALGQIELACSGVWVNVDWVQKHAKNAIQKIQALEFSADAI